MRRRCYAVPLLAILIFFASTFARGQVLLEADYLKWFQPWRGTGLYDTANPFLRNPYLQDPLFAYYPLWNFYNASLKHGRFPLWDPLEGCGYPCQALHDQGLSFPVNIVLHWLLPTLAAFQLSLLLQTLACFACMAWFVRGLGLSRGAAALAGLAWSLGNWPICFLELGYGGWMGAFLPLCLRAIDDARQQRWYGWPLLGTAVASLVLSTHLQLVALAMAIVLAYGVGRGRGVSLAGALLLGMGAAAVHLVPVAGLVGDAHRFTGYSLGDLFGSARLFPRHLLTYFWPFLLGAPHDGFQLGGVTSMVENPIEQCLYVGVLPALLAIVGAWRGRGRLPRLLAGCVVAGLLLCMVPLLYGTLFWLLPPLHGLTPTRLLFPVGFCVVLLAAYGWEAMERGERAVMAWGAAAGVACVAVCVLVMGAESSAQWFDGWVVDSVRGGILKPPYMQEGFGSLMASRIHAHFSFSDGSMLLGALWLAASATVLCCWERRWARWAGLMMVALDLFVYASTINPGSPASLVYPPTSATTWLQGNVGAGRAAGLVRMAHPNSLTMYGISDVAVYHSVLPGRYHDLLRAINADPPGVSTNMSDLYHATHLSRGLADLLGVSVFYTLPGYALPAPAAPAVAQGDLLVSPWGSGLRAFAVGAFEVRPRAEVLEGMLRADFDPRRMVYLEEVPSGWSGGEPGPAGDVRVARYEAERVELEADMKRAGMVVLTDNWYPGWRASCDGAPCPLLVADYSFRGVVVPAGRHLVTMSFQPRAFWMGLVVSAVCVLLLAVWALERRRQGLV